MPTSHPIAPSPQSVGIDPEKLEALFERSAREVREGLLPSAQVAIARHGKIAGMRTFGSVTHGGQPAPATNETLYVIYSCTKAITSAAAWMLIQDGKLGLDERVSDVVPGFESNGKEAVRVEHLFTHTAGFPYAPMPPETWHDRDARLARFARWRLTFEPGSRMEYHATASMWVIAEIIERRSGRPYQDFVRSRIAEPLGLEDFHVGLPPEKHARLADVVHVGEALSPEELAGLGFPVNPNNEVTEEALEAFNRPEARSAGVPGGGGTMTAADLVLFYQALLRDLSPHDGARLWRQETLEDVLRIRTGEMLDPMVRKPANRAVGVTIAGGEDRVFRGFGHSNSARAFGHMGAGGQVAWADPETGISFVYLTNGCDRHPLRQGRRGVGLSSRAAACLLAE
jgi:CubicO group peptidase (beta-lactamase class C family)